MEVDAIGATLGSENSAVNNAVSQDDFIKLFLAQLSFQDPLEPINNEQFLAQMAQFANLEQSRQIAESLEQQNYLVSTGQATTMLGKTVEVLTSTGSTLGTVSAITYSQNGATLTVSKQDGSFIPNVRLSQIRTVTN
jgi:flagellar basal-body rod modification protein FlgD